MLGKEKCKLHTIARQTVFTHAFCHVYVENLLKRPVLITMLSVKFEIKICLLRQSQVKLQKIQNELKDIRNSTEFGLFYQGLPKKTLHMQGEKCRGSKHSKVRLTGMAATSAAGEKFPIFAVGKSAKPRALKTSKAFPVVVGRK